MKPEHTPPPSDDPEANNAAGAGCMARLVLRFRAMADARYEVAARRLENGRTSQALVATADAYMRCARELERAMEGEEPPNPGEEWPDEEDCRNLCN
jgi:hypothetical protein